MFAKEAPRWVTLGGMLLACSAGCINSVGLLGLHHQALTHLSGTITLFGAELGQTDFRLAGHAFLIVVAFFGGCVLSGFIIQQSTLKLGRRYGAVLLAESALLVAAVWMLNRGSFTGDVLASMACGLQNAMATSYSGAVIRTTHMTGIVTDLGIATGHLLRGKRVDTFRLRLYGALLIGFFGGSVLGAIGYAHFRYGTLLFPAALSGLAGAVHTVAKYWERQTRHSTPSSSHPD